MTEEQIKQNAEIRVFCENSFRKEHKKLTLTPSEEKIAKDFYIAGAHSRDEEIRELLKDREKFYREKISALADAQELRNELDKLRNPWISVEERLPEEDPVDKGYSVNVIGMFPDGSVSHCFCSIEDGVWFIEGLTCDRPTHWMPIPELKKGE